MISTPAKLWDDARVVLFHGEALQLRKIEPSDRARFEQLIALSDLRDLQMRFFGVFRELPPTLLDQLLHANSVDAITLVAIRTGTDGASEILADARAHATSSATAELGLLVRSDLKGMGLGAMLLEGIIGSCRRRGLSLLEADVLHENERMLQLARKYGFKTKSVEASTVHLMLDLCTAGAC
jgi:acetyltransferase